MASIFKTGVPVALGIVTQPDSTAAAVAILANFTGVAGTAESRFNSLEFEPMKSADKTANLGNIYIGYLGMNISTGVGVIKTLAKTDLSWKIGGEGLMGNNINAEELYLQSATNGDGAQVRGRQV